MNDKELDKLFKEQLAHRNVHPRKDIWLQIDGELHEQPMSIRRLKWISYAAIIVGCLGLVALLYNMLLPTPIVNSQAVVEKEVPTVQINTGQEPSKTEFPIIPVQPKYAEESKQLEEGQTKKNIQKISIPEEKKFVTDALLQEKKSPLKLAGLKPAKLSLSLTDSLRVEDKVLRRQVIDIRPIAPLIDSYEEEESLLASDRKTTEGILPGILNKISEALDPTENTTFQFSKDDEGFLRLDIVNSLVKNRNKKRR